MSSIPKVSVVMSSYNRSMYIREAIESILNQSYKDFEFIIIDDCSTDNSVEIIEEYANKDSRIVFLKNTENKGLIYSLNKGFDYAKGKYIARMDDDDIALPNRFEKQVKYMDENSEVIVLGSFIEAFGTTKAKSWVSISDPDELSVAINFYNPICHPSVIIRKSFIDENKLRYSPKALHAEEYDLWKEIILKGGKLANYPEILLKYRCHNKRISVSSKSSKIQDKTAERVREELLSRFIKTKKEIKKIRNSIFKFPFEYNNKKRVSNVTEKMKKYPNIISSIGIKKFEENFLGIVSDMNIFFASDDKFSQHLCVAMASILKNALPIDFHNFYILDGGISNKNKRKIEKVKEIKDCKIEYIKINDSIFNNCKITKECQHISKQTYYRYLIAELKPELKRAFYFDCDIVVNDTLNNFWNINLENKYVAAVEELWIDANNYYKSIGVNNSFNAGVMLINIEKWVKDDITNKLFKINQELSNSNKLRWQDQDVLNIVFNNNVLFVSPKFNLQQTAFFDGQYSQCTDVDMDYSKLNPCIIHYSGYFKPWHKICKHPYWNKYFRYLRFTAFYHQAIIKRYINMLYTKIKQKDLYQVKILGLTIFKFDKRNYYIKKKILGIQYKNEFLIRQYLDDKFYYLYSIIDNKNK